MHALQRCVAAIFFGLLAVSAQADVPLFRPLGAAQGLPSERVHALAQDLHGCLWVGTADGLARFDGTRFEVFHHDPRRDGALPANNVQALHVDAHGRIWAGFEGGGLAEVLDHGERVSRWLGADGVDAEADVWAIASDPDGRLYFGGFGTGLVRVDPRDGTRRAFGTQDGLLSEHILALADDGQGRLWIASYGGLQYLEGDNLRTPAAELGAPPPGPVFSLGLQDGVLWVGTRSGVLRGEQGRFEAVPALGGAPALSLVEDAEGALWVGRLAGLDLMTRDAPQRAALSPRHRSGQRSVLELLRDHEDGLWIASDGGGLLHLPSQWRRFRSWVPEEGGLGGAAPGAAAFDAEGALWSGGSDGVVERIDPSSGAPQRVLEADTRWPDRQITGLLIHGGRLFVGTRQGLLIHAFQPPLAALRILAAGAADPHAPPLGVIDQMLAGADGSIWLSSYGGGIEHRASNGDLLRRYGEAEGLAGLDTEQMRWGPDGRLWVAGGDGLQRLDPRTQRFESLPALAGERVFGFAFTADQRLWAARRDGLLELARQDDEWRAPVSLALLVGLEVGGLSSDADGRLWASSSRGLWRIDPQRLTERRFGVRDGLPGQEFRDRPLAESADGGRFAAILPQALVQVDSALFGGVTQAPRLRLDPVSLRRQGRVAQLDPEQGVSLWHDDREIAFAARVASFVEPDAWRFRMRLEPFDADWVELGGNGQRIFPLLPPANYRLHVQAAGPDGEWHAHPALRVSVAPPWWAEPWARVGQGLALVLIGWLLFRAYRRRGEARAAAALAESERRWALQASEQKSQFLATLAHEIRTPMTGLLGMAELLGRTDLDVGQRRQLEAVRRSGDLLRRLVDDALDLARIEAGRLEIRPRPMALREACRQAVETLAEPIRSKGLQAGCDLHEPLPDWVEGDPERLQQILLNLLGNALKFTREGGIRLSVRSEATPWVVLEVIDSGPGIDPAQRERLLRRFEQAEGEDTARQHGGAGLGLAISSELARAMGGSLQLDEASDGGACVRVRLPLPAVDPPEAMDAQGPDGEPNGAGLSVLLVEDDALAAEAIRGLLASLGHRVRHAAHALEALAELEAAPADIALIDLDLPGLDGLQLAGLIGARHPALPLLAVSARSAPGTEEAVRAAGMRGILRKPVGSATLAAGLRAAQEMAGVPAEE